jgi:hypothetical protein
MNGINPDEHSNGGQRLVASVSSFLRVDPVSSVTSVPFIGRFQKRRRGATLRGSRAGRGRQRHKPAYLARLLPFELIHGADGHQRVPDA